MHDEVCLGSTRSITAQGLSLPWPVKSQEATCNDEWLLLLKGKGARGVLGRRVAVAGSGQARQCSRHRNASFLCRILPVGITTGVTEFPLDSQARRTGLH